jgi:hypothetical protein
VPVVGPWTHLRLFRLSDEDPLLSKLMRDDPHDFGDACFLVERRRWDRAEVRRMLRRARLPASREIAEEFAKASQRLLGRVE